MVWQRGDRLLKYIAKILRETMQDRDLCHFGRINADVFGMCAEVTGEADTLFIARHIHEKMKEYQGLNCYLETCAGCYIIEDKERWLSRTSTIKQPQQRKVQGQIYGARGILYRRNGRRGRA